MAMVKLPSWRDWPLASKLAMMLTVLAIVPLGFVGLYNDVTARSGLLTATRAQNQQRARGTVEVLDAYLAELLADVHVAGELPQLGRFLRSGGQEDPGLRAETLAVLDDMRAAHGYDALYLADPSGMVLLATDERLLGRSYIAASDFRNAIAGQTTFDEPRYDPQDGQVYLRFAAPVRSVEGIIQGAIIGRITLASLDRIIAADNDFAGRGDFGILWDDLGIRLSMGRFADLRFKPFAPLAADVAQALAVEGRFGPATASLLADAGQLTTVVERSKWLFYDRSADPHLRVTSNSADVLNVVIVPLTNKRWLYGIFTPESSIVAAQNTQTQRLLLAIAVVGGLVLLTALVAARWATGPIRRVAETADAIAAGDLARRVRLAQRDEVGRLASAFDAMADALADKERQLRHRAVQLEAANRELEAFSYSVSHDLRAPLRAIDGFSQALQEEYAGLLDETGQGYLRWVRVGSQQMSQLIEGLLALSRVTRAELRRESVDLSSMALAIVDELRLTQPDRHVEFVIAPGLAAEGDTRLLRVVLGNLLGNAWKFTARHPTAQIEFGRTADSGLPMAHLSEPHRTESPNLHAVVYYVRDDGAGFDMAYAAKLFGAFQRLHGAAEFEGTGIGLATVRRIVQRHGGRIWAEGAVEMGATFYFTLEGGDELQDHLAG